MPANLVRRTQPQNPVEVNWSNPITKGLVFAAIPVGNSFYDCVTQVMGTVNGTVTAGVRVRNGGKSATNAIRVLVAGSASSNYIDWPVSSSLRGATMAAGATILALGAPDTQVDGNFYTIAGNADPIATGDGFGLEIDSFAFAGRGGIIKTNYIDVNIYGISADAALGNPFNNQIHFFGYTTANNGASGSWFYNDIAEAYSGATTHGTTTANRRAAVFSPSGASGRHDSALGLVLFWDRAITLAEYMSLYTNPWQVFEQTRPAIWLPVSVASGVSGSMAASNQNDTSSASGTTTVVGTLARTNTNDTMSASGAPTASGSSAATAQNDTMSASGTTTVRGTMAATNAGDTMAAAGAPGDAVAGTMAATNQGDSMSAAGTTTVRGTMAAQAGNDTMGATGTPSINGAMSATNQNDTMSASGTSGTPVAGGTRLRPMVGFGQ